MSERNILRGTDPSRKKQTQIDDMSVSRRSDFKKIIGPIKRPSRATKAMSMKIDLNRDKRDENNEESKRGEGEDQDDEEDEEGDEEDEEDDEIPNPNNLPILDVKILAVGMDQEELNKIIDVYGAVEGE